MSESDLDRDDDAVAFGFVSQLHRVLWQRRWFVIIPFLVLSAAGVAAALLLPATYRSTATLLVESQSLPQTVASSPVTSIVDQRIARIRQQVLSRGDLIGLIQQYGLYYDERQDKPLSEVVDDMREAISVAAIDSNVGQRRDGTDTIAFAVSFDYAQPTQAQLVTQSLVERILELDASQSSEQAQNTVDFLSQQAGGLQSQIEDIEGRITRMKAENGLVLSANNLSPISSAASYDAQISALRRENAMIRRSAASGGSEDPLVAAAEAELANAQANYADTHPDIALARRRLAEARRLAAERARSRPDSAMDAEGQIAANNGQIAALERARDQDANRAEQLLVAQSRAPAVIEQVSQLEARANALREQQREVAERQLAAQSSARMEREQMGERLSVNDPPVVPDSPISPNRPLLVLGGIAAGLGLGVLLALAVELIQRPIRGAGDLEAVLGVPPLVVIPVIATGPEQRHGRRIWPFRRRKRRRPRIQGEDIAGDRA